MDILIITNEMISIPPKSGNTIRTLYFIDALAEHHQLSILCYQNNNALELDKLNIEVKKYFKNIWLVNKTNIYFKNKFIERIKGLKYFFTCIPWEIGFTFSDEFEKKILEIIKNNNFDIIVARTVYMGQYLIKNIDKIKGKIIIDIDDIEFIKKYRNMEIEGYSGFYDKYRKKLNNYILKKYYKNLNYINKSIVCSGKDENYLKTNKLINNTFVIPNAIDISIYNKIKSYNEQNLNNKIILFCGMLDYQPNYDGIKWFIKNIFPLIIKKDPGIKLYIIGRSNKKEIFNHVDNKSIFVFLNVESVIPYYENCSLVIVPIRIAGGTRIKILEALSCRRPIVSTTIGAEGIELINNKHCIIEDIPEKFAAACIKLLNEFNFTLNLTEEGFRFVKENYGISVINNLIRKLFETV